MMAESTRTPECRCLACGHKISAASEMDNTGERPVEGNLTVCLYCGAVMMFDHDLTLRGMTDAEMDGVMADCETMNLLAKIVRRVRLLPKAN